MLKGLGDIGNLMKMQKELKNIQKRITKTKLEGEDKKGLLKVIMTGEHKMVEVTFSDQMAGKSKEDLEKAVVEAVNDAVEKIKKFSSEEMKKMTGGMNIPGMGNMF